MLQLFKSGRTEAYIIVVLIGLLAWLPGLLATDYLEHPEKLMIGYGLVATLFSPFKFLSIGFTILMVFVGAFLVNALSDNFEIRTKANLLPALMYLIFSAVLPIDHRLNPVIIANLFLLGSSWLIFDTYRSEKANTNIFLGAMFLTGASFFYFPAILHLLTLFISLTLLRPFLWKEWAIGLIGFLIPFIYLFSYYYFDDRLGEKLQYILIDGWQNWDWRFQFNTSNTVFLIVIGLFFVFSLFVHLGLMSTGKVKAQKYLTVIFFSLLFSILIVALTQNWSQSASVILAFPLSIMFGNLFMQIKSGFVGELCFWLFLIAISIVKLQLLS
jgi:hypothetical protein